MLHPSLDAPVAAWIAWVDSEFPFSPSYRRPFSGTLLDIHRIQERELAAEAARLYFRQRDTRPRGYQGDPSEIDRRYP